MGKNSKARRMQKLKAAARKYIPAVSKKAMSSHYPVRFSELLNPFASLTDTQRVEIINGVGEQAREDLPAQLTSLQELLCRYEPTHLLSFAAKLGLTIGVSKGGLSTTDS